MQSADPGEFGRRLRRLRESAALSQEDLAERANLTAKAIGALERGERRRPYPNTVRALCAALGLDDEGARALADAVRAPSEQRPSSEQQASSEQRRPVPSTPTRIPAPPAPMLGRTTALAHVRELLDRPTSRIVTLTGPGGVGKTRLSLELAQQLQDDRRDVVLVELAGIRQVDLVMPTIARAFGLSAGSDDLIGSVAGLLAERSPVLVLDNVEHLLGAATEVAELVGRCPTLVVLATSRAPLRIRAEVEVPLAPLALPLAEDDVAEVAASPAAQMFEDRARSVVPDFAVDASNATAVAAICRRVDGLPLALELAAAHLRYLPPSQLLDRLGHAVDSGRLRDLPERQQTMRATLDWSRDLLTTDELDVLRALSVFAGGFDVAAAEVVAGAPGRDVLTALEGLVEQSLVVGPAVAEPGAVPRSRLLESVREYAAAAIADGEASVLSDRHAAYFADLGGEALVGLRTLDLPRWLDRLEAEHDNLRAALTTQLERGELGAAAQLGRDTWLYWALRGHAGEGLVWWQRVLDEGRDGGLDERGRAAAHLTVAGLRFAVGDIEGTRRHAASAAVSARVAEAPSELVEALMLSCMGAAFSGDLADAAAHLDAIAEVSTEEVDAWSHAHVLIAGAQVSLLNGDLEQCAGRLGAAEELGRRQAGQFTLCTALNMRTTLALLVDDDELALACAAEAAELAAAVGTTWTLVYSLSALATIASRRGRSDLAAELFAASAAVAETSLIKVAFRPDLDAAEVQLREIQRQLGGEEFDRCWDRGRSRRVEDLLDLIPEISAPHAPS